MNKVITVKMPVDLRAAVRAKSRATGVSLSAVVRSALAAWVADERPIVEPADLTGFPYPLQIPRHRSER